MHTEEVSTQANTTLTNQAGVHMQLQTGTKISAGHQRVSRHPVKFAIYRKVSGKVRTTDRAVGDHEVLEARQCDMP